MNRDFQHVIFLHIPKTAGTTMRHIIDRQYAPEEIHAFGADAFGSIRAFQALPLEERAQIKLLSGHMGYGLHTYLPGKSIYFTFLRDPVERVISYFNFILRTPDHYLYEIVMSQQMSLKDLLETDNALMMNDGQVRLISGVWADPAFGETTREMLAMAENHLKTHFLVGLTEEFDASLCLLKERLNWQGEISYQRYNVTTTGFTRETLPAETVTLIKEVNQLDIALYAFAKNLFRQQAQAQGVSFPLRVKLFQTNSIWKSPYMRMRRFSVRTYVKQNILGASSE